MIEKEDRNPHGPGLILIGANFPDSLYLKCRCTYDTQKYSRGMLLTFQISMYMDNMYCIDLGF